VLSNCQNITTIKVSRLNGRHYGLICSTKQVIAKRGRTVGMNEVS
jgi:hypothetical protein